MYILWITFITLSLLIFISGATLSKTADKIATKTGIGGLWIGVLTLPLITSIPEIVIGIRAATIDSVNLALGNLYGSNMLNLFTIIFIDFFSGKKMLSRTLQQGHILTGGLYIVIAGISLLGMTLKWVPAFGFIGIDSIIIFMLYISTVRFIYRDQKRKILAKNINFKNLFYKDILIFIAAAVVAILASRRLADTGNLIAARTGLEETLFGSIFVAISTTLPEIVIIISAARIGAFDMAVGNILGANILNLGLLFLVDLFYTQGPLLIRAGEGHYVSGIISITMTAILIIGITYRSQKNIFQIGLDTIFVVLMYCIGILNLVI